MAVLGTSDTGPVSVRLMESGLNWFVVPPITIEWPFVLFPMVRALASVKALLLDVVSVVPSPSVSVPVPTGPAVGAPAGPMLLAPITRAV